MIKHNNNSNNKNFGSKKKRKIIKLKQKTNISNLDKNENEIFDDNDFYCKQYDPFKLIVKRLQIIPKEFCMNSISSHKCYINEDSFFLKKNGLICKMRNIIIDPSKFLMSRLNYDKGPLKNKSKGFPILQTGFFNTECKSKNISYNNFNHELYNFYINSWNYNYKLISNYEELAPNKTIFFVSRNGSPNLFFAGAGIINALALMYYFNLKPENIQVVFLQSLFAKKDPSFFFIII